jgi:ATP-binding cassette subfamily C (CFTR/MRP) protein 1
VLVDGPRYRSFHIVLCMDFSIHFPVGLLASPRSLTATETDSNPAVWLKWWADSDAAHPNQKTSMYLGIYSVFQVAALIFLGFTFIQTFNGIAVRSGLKLHKIALLTMTSAPMSLFSWVDNGVLLNRLSQDFELIDGELPINVLNLAVGIFLCIGQAVLIASATFYVAIAYPFIAGVFYYIQKYYLRTSRQLRFMDLESKSPLYTQFIESLSGLVTIRAFGWQQNERELNRHLLDTSQKPFYLLFMIQRWLTVVLDLVSGALALVVTGLAVGLRTNVSPGFTGVALVNIINFNVVLQNLVMWYKSLLVLDSHANIYWLLGTQLETSIGAVSRVKAFSEKTEVEALPEETNDPPENWPLRGLVEFKDVSAAYKYVFTSSFTCSSIIQILS